MVSVLSVSQAALGGGVADEALTGVQGRRVNLPCACIHVVHIMLLDLKGELLAHEGLA